MSKIDLGVFKVLDDEQPIATVPRRAGGMMEFLKFCAAMFLVLVMSLFVIALGIMGFELLINGGIDWWARPLGGLCIVVDFFIICAIMYAEFSKSEA